jgi:hypothetical protein
MPASFIAKWFDLRTRIYAAYELIKRVHPLVGFPLPLAIIKVTHHFNYQLYMQSECKFVGHNDSQERLY